MALADNSNNQTKIFVTVKPNNTIIVQPQNNTEIEKLVQKLTEKPLYTYGDIIITSGTIFAFFGFGSFLVLKFESTKWEKQLDWMAILLIFIGAVQMLHLSVIISIMVGWFHDYIYAIILGATIGFLGIILFAVYKIAYYENKYSSVKLDTIEKTKAFKDGVELGQKTISERIVKQLDDLRRERLRFQHETGF